MKCTICKKEIILVPSAQERARKYGGKASDYTKLFPRHARCELIKRGCKPGPYPRSPCEVYNTKKDKD